MSLSSENLICREAGDSHLAVESTLPRSQIGLARTCLTLGRSQRGLCHCFPQEEIALSWEMSMLRVSRNQSPSRHLPWVGGLGWPKESKML